MASRRAREEEEQPSEVASTAGGEGIEIDWKEVQERSFYGEHADLVFEGMVSDFNRFDDSLNSINERLETFVAGMEKLTAGILAINQGITSQPAFMQDKALCSDCYRLKEAANQIAHEDAPHSAISKMRRNLEFNISKPIQSHLENNGKLKEKLEKRQARLDELKVAKQQMDECIKRNLSSLDNRYVLAQNEFEISTKLFEELDRPIFEWLYLLESYQGDILDSSLQTLKYLQYDFFSSSAHALSNALPERMQFRPVPDMVPESLQLLVEQELRAAEGEESDICSSLTELQTDVTDSFSARLVERMAREDEADDITSPVPVDVLSLSSLLAQGFEEGPARRALRLHQNNTQAALDWLVEGGVADEPQTQSISNHRAARVLAARARRSQRLQQHRTEASDHDESSRGTWSAPSAVAFGLRESFTPHV